MESTWVSVDCFARSATRATCGSGCSNCNNANFDLGCSGNKNVACLTADAGTVQGSVLTLVGFVIVSVLFIWL
jgi:hypothetical protein